MNASELPRKVHLCIGAMAPCAAAAGVSFAQQRNHDEEVQTGQEVFHQPKAKGEIIESSALSDQQKTAITRAAQPRYNHPIKFFLVHEAQPHTFATAGGVGGENKPRFDRSRCRYHQIRLVLEERKKKRHDRRSVYDDSHGRRHRDGRRSLRAGLTVAKFAKLGSLLHERPKAGFKPWQ